MKDKIEKLINRYEQWAEAMARQIPEAGEVEGYILMARKYVIQQVFVPDLKNLLKEMSRTATIYTIREDGSRHAYGTYAFATAGEKARVNELALQLADERGCGVEVREEDDE